MSDAAGEQAGGAGAAGQLWVRLRLQPPMRQLLREIARHILAKPAAKVSLPQGGTTGGEAPDAELLAAWTAGLHESDTKDTAALYGLLQRPDFGQADVALSPGEAEAVIRAGVKVRLHLHATALRDALADDVNGPLKFYRLPPAEQQAYACYRLLVIIEGELLVQLDPGLAEV